MKTRREFFYGAGALSLAGRLSPLSVLADPALSTGSIAGAAKKLEAFDYRGVRLLPGMFQRQVEATRETYFRIPNDDMLKGFRREAGLPDPGNNMGGWASRDSGTTFGQWISGMARLSCALGDDAMRDKAVALIEEWKKTIGPGGNCRMGVYDWEKMSCGLVDAALYAGYDRALTILEEITEWAMKNFDRSRSPAVPVVDPDGRKPRGANEWYTLPENSYRAYLITGKPIFRDFADLWKYNSYWDKFETSVSPAGVAYLHAYSHVNTFSSAAMAYAVTGDARYLRILENAHAWAMRTQAYATGGYGPHEWTVPPDGTLGRALETSTDSAEIPCGSWAAFKLSRYLLGFTGQAKYGEWLETLLYNGIGAALPVRLNGQSFYYANYRLDMASKQYHWDEWPCCSGTYIQTVADFHNVIYFRDADGLYVNLLVPSEATWLHRGQSVTVRQETDFPEANEICWTVQTEQPVAMALQVRIPAWAKETTFSLNGKPLPAAAPPGQWARIGRTWRHGDTLVMTVGMPLYAVPVDSRHPNRSAIMYGPVLLAQHVGTWVTYLELNREPLSTRFTRISRDLQFQVSDLPGQEQHTGGFRPFYALPERAPYRVYFDLRAPRFFL